MTAFRDPIGEIVQVVDQVMREHAVSRRPLGDFVLIRPLEASNQAGGMEIPETQAERPSAGVVVMTGPGRVTDSGLRILPEVLPGDVVLFPPYAGKEILLQLPEEAPRSYILCRQDEIYFNDGPSQKGS